MNPDLKNISSHIHYIGTGVLAQAQRNALYTSMGVDSRLDEGIYAVLQAAHAAELIIKAVIAEEHPLLIFSNLPKSNKNDSNFLSFSDLFENGKTIQYAELPEKLWATTGYRIKNLALFSSFGKLRNCIQHFATPDIDLRIEASKFIYEIIDPILEFFWGEYAIEYVDLNEYEYDVFEILQTRGLVVRYPEHMAEYAEKAYKV